MCTARAHSGVRMGLLAALASCALLAAACAPSSPKLAPKGGVERGVASWYGPGFHGRLTASGEIYDMHALTAAHPSLPFGSMVEVTNLDNGRRVRVRINDRGPFLKNRVIDLSYAAAETIEMIGAGTARVQLALLGTAPVEPVRYTVQVGAFQDQVRAEELAAQLGSLFPAVEVRSDGAWHRVQIGEYTVRELADDLRRRLHREGFSALVVALR